MSGPLELGSISTRRIRQVLSPCVIAAAMKSRLLRSIATRAWPAMMPHVTCCECTHDHGISQGAGPRPGPRRETRLRLSRSPCVNTYKSHHESRGPFREGANVPRQSCLTGSGRYPPFGFTITKLGSSTAHRSCTVRSRRTGPRRDRWKSNSPHGK